MCYYWWLKQQCVVLVLVLVVEQNSKLTVLTVSNNTKVVPSVDKGAVLRGTSGPEHCVKLSSAQLSRAEPIRTWLLNPADNNPQQLVNTHTETKLQSKVTNFIFEGPSVMLFMWQITAVFVFMLCLFLIAAPVSLQVRTNQLRPFKLCCSRLWTERFEDPSDWSQVRSELKLEILVLRLKSCVEMIQTCSNWRIWSE